MEIGLITVGSAPDCDNLPPAGMSTRLILANYIDVQKIYSDDDQRIVSIEMVPGKFAYEFFGFRRDVEKSDEVVRREKSKQRIKHFLSFVIYDNSQQQKNNIRNVVTGRLIAIVENNGKNDNSLELLGRECGLSIVDGQIRNAYENGGVFTINIGTPDNGIEFERKLPQTLGISYEDGLGIIDDILTPLSQLTVDNDIVKVDSTIITADQTYY
jgi:hypothetical protein